ncbi:anti-CRISPR protein AcrFgp36, partial [Pseudomonas aeruginosa]
GLRGATHPTEKEAMAAALGYLWKCRQDLVAIARNDAIEAEKYRAKA